MSTPQILTPRSVVLLGIPFHDVTLEEALLLVLQMVRERIPRQVATANLDFAMQASRDVELQRILLEADLVLCDGMPLVWLSRWVGPALRERVAGSDLTPRLFRLASEHGLRLFLLGADDETLKTLTERMSVDYPGAVLCGTLAPPRARLHEFDHTVIGARIREARPDILIVAFGCPKQEKWITMHYRSLGVPVSIGVGASLEMMVGRFQRAPRWMQVSGLEWLYRLLQEPGRLLHRYWMDLLFYVRRVWAEKALMRRTSREKSGRSESMQSGEMDCEFQSWTGVIDAAGLQAGTITVQGMGQPGTLVLVLSEVTFMDSSGLGLLLRAYREKSRAGGRLILFRPSAQVQRLLAVLQLSRALPIALSYGDIQRLASPSQATPHGQVHWQEEGRRLVIEVVGELTAVKVEEWRQWWRAESQLLSGVQEVVMNLAACSFMDSSGLGFLLQMKKECQQRLELRFRLWEVTPAVANVLKIAQLSQHFDWEPSRQDQA